MTITALALPAAAFAVYLVLKRLLAPRASGTTVQEKLAAGALVVDVRSPGEFRGGAFPTAINIPLNELGTRLAGLSRDKPVVLYCASGSRSALAARMFRQAGFADVINAGALHDMPR